MAVYYNAVDPAACAWLRELIAAGHLPAGEVDERSILEVEPADVRGFAQCHFFAGIGGWPHALRLAGVAGDLSVWTGSPPCQPFSQAGQRKGQDDERHLAPAFLRLVAACRPELVFGEQVASAAVLGPVGRKSRPAVEGPAGWAWFDALAADLETASYAVAAADLPAAGIGAPHIRQRLFFGAVAMDTVTRGLGDGIGEGPQGRVGMPGGADKRVAGSAGLARGLADGDGRLARHGAIQRGRQHRCKPQDGEAGRLVEGADLAGTDATDGVWRDPDWLLCRDGRWPPVESGTFPLADGISGRMGLLRGYGNAIVPPLAAEFVTAFLESLR
ncbi:DNA cytosine methyltransferase [Paracoccus sediminicola]|uniref:DNA cytosine methyltransferase n=1 Tax=Paracoccus sediminicola TaxID=3017783 RepID=UPI0022F0EC45|nr:DNA cytosine methyltransferase [Paracoccus sediminicola]WBU58024.1 DNA cytosine methyltransferase [Paracoccus sediminicola]